MNSKSIRLLALGGTLLLAACSSEKNTASNPGSGKESNSTDKNAIALGHCESASTTPCGDFTTPTGTSMTFGPYGAIMEPNVGKGFENKIAAGDADDGTTCKNFANGFMEDPKLTADLLDIRDLDFSLYTVYRPVNWKEGETYPVITWGNGTCAQPDGYGALLRYVASYGYFIVAANSRWVGGSTEMLHGLDFAAAANEDPSSPYYHKLELDRIGAMGHSQGSAGTALSALDPRVKAVILFNAGATASKPYMAVSGEQDITGFTPASMATAVNAAPEGAYMFFHMVSGMGPLRGHLTLMMQPERVTAATAAWWGTMFNDDADSRAYFTGSDCKLCNQTAEFDFGEHGLD